MIYLTWLFLMIEIYAVGYCLYLSFKEDENKMVILYVAAALTFMDMVKDDATKIIEYYDQQQPVKEIRV